MTSRLTSRPSSEIDVVEPGDEEHFSRRPEPPLTEAELAFRKLIRNPRQLARWSAQVLAEWKAAHPEKVAAPRKQAPKKAPKKAPTYNQRWDPAAIEARQKTKEK